jgi:hypothetical protein
MKIRGVLLGWGANDKGYRWIDVEGLRLDIGKDRWSEAFLNSVVAREVEVWVQIDWRKGPGGRWFNRRRVLSIRPVGD